ncbi:hypothetical protein ACLOJK_034417 [Asimina triloba]
MRKVLVCSRNGSVYSFELRFWLVKSAATNRFNVGLMLAHGGISSDYLEFSLKGGRLLWEFDTGGPITASAYVDENIQLTLDSTNLSSLESSSGKVHVLRIESNATRMSNGQAEAAGGPFVQKFASLELPGEIFSSPVMIGGRIFVGCRDDHVYCIDVICKSHEG